MKKSDRFNECMNFKTLFSYRCIAVFLPEQIIRTIKVLNSPPLREHYDLWCWPVYGVFGKELRGGKASGSHTSGSDTDQRVTTAAGSTL